MEITEEQKIVVQKYKEIQDEFKSIKGTMNLLRARAKELMFELEEIRNNEGALIEKLEKK
tara:strand:+ start:3977 stop:4156 length:180 start_codon:yes stop_codon:yes gene_type:complete